MARAKVNLKEKVLKPIEDQRVIGKGTQVRVVQASEGVDWLAGAPVCDLLKQRGIVHAGWMLAKNPFAISRKDQSGTFMMACLGGKGEILVDGRWQVVEAGEACLMPPFVGNSLRGIEGESWEFCWVRYLESREAAPIVSAVSPVKAAYEAPPLKHSIEGLIAESEEEPTPAIQHHWVELIHQYVLRFSQPYQKDDRLWKLWKAVEPHYNRNWSLSDLAEVACVSEEHLRRLCRKQLGRSPMQHLLFLRMQKASELLATTDHKIETISMAVGYKNAFHFSNVFTKIVGRRPSTFRSS